MTRTPTASDRPEPPSDGGAVRGLRRAVARAGHVVLVAVTAIVDVAPPRLRFGHLTTALAVLRPPGGLPTLAAPGSMPARPSRDQPSSRSATATDSKADPRRPRVALLAGDLDTGGIETVVAVLAKALPRLGIETVVVATTLGRTADALVEDGVRVIQAGPRQVARVVADVQPDVLQLHRLDLPLMEAATSTGLPVVPVFHAMETYLDDVVWNALDRLAGNAPLGVAVSSTVAQFVADRLTQPLELRVVVNCAPSTGAAPSRGLAREGLGRLLGEDLEGTVVVVSLARYSDQKNVPGLVDAFLLAATQDPRLRLVVAGEPNSWLEFRRADALRRSHRLGRRVHLLGTSDPAALLAAADVFALDSFAEGGPVAAVEAAAHGLPLVLSDVGFARELLACPGVNGIMVSRATGEVSAPALARARRRLHQSNRVEFARGLVRVGGNGAARSRLPEIFTEQAMVAAHAAALEDAARRPPGTRSSDDAASPGAP